MTEEMPAKIGDDLLGDRGREIAVTHGAEALQQYQTQEEEDELIHPPAIVLDGDHIPQGTGQTQ